MIVLNFGDSNYYDIILYAVDYLYNWLFDVGTTDKRKTFGAFYQKITP